jgi:tRNA-specific 2-thiouridylase
MKRVVVGLSGGVDSSVAAYLLQQQGYEVIGLFMKNWHDDSVTISNECPWLEDSNDALLVAEKLGIPFQTVDLSEQYKERIVDYMFAEYEKGRTPNPDVLCNREIKFDVFMKIALDLGADFVATGHYCRKGETQANGNTAYQLLSGVDKNKDQSYFLCQLSQEQLAKALFPIGELTKPEVREIAAQMDLVTAEKKDSQGLCFRVNGRLP